MTTYQLISNILIGLLGVTAVALSMAKRDNLRRWAPVFGMAGQPSWFYTTYTSGQWGIFFVCFLYTLVWGKGLYDFWVRPMIREAKAGADLRIAQESFAAAFDKAHAKHKRPKGFTRGY